MRQPYEYYVIINGIPHNLNELDVYMLTEDDLEDLDEIAYTMPDYIEDWAQQCHEINVEYELKAT